MSSNTELAAGIITAIIGVAVVSVVLSANANTVNVLGTAFQGISQTIATAISPITGG